MKKSLLLSLATFLIFGILSSGHASTIDTNALSLLKRMSDTLSGAKSFTVRVNGIFETPCNTGQLVTVTSAGKLALQRPNKLRAIYGGDAHAFDFFYEGNAVTAVAPYAKVFSTTKAPDTIDGMLDGVRRETGIHIHTAPLLRTSPYATLTRHLLSAVIIGPSAVDGIPCDHLAFRSPGVDWELWISSGKTALPHRLAATFTDRPGSPRKFMEFSSWNLHPGLRSSLFSFQQPRDFREIPFKAVLNDARQGKVQEASVR